MVAHASSRMTSVAFLLVRSPRKKRRSVEARADMTHASSCVMPMGRGRQPGEMNDESSGYCRIAIRFLLIDRKKLPARQDRLRQNIVAVTNRCAVQSAAANLAQSTGSVQSSSLLTFRRHQLHFYVVPRKLIPKLQASSQGIQKTSMVRFYSSIHSDDEIRIRQMSCDSAFRGNPQPKSPPQIERKNRMSRQRSRWSRT
jgi:hypothetical protein